MPYLHCFTKKAFAILLTSAILLSLVSCVILEDAVPKSLGGYDRYEYYRSAGIQDHIAYAKYYYPSANTSENIYFTKIQETDFPTINVHLEDFEKWIELINDEKQSRELVANYDFSHTLIDTEDYIYIRSESHTWSDGYTSLVNYDIYFFDVQTLVLYYFHSNI